MSETEPIFQDAVISWSGIIDLPLFYKKIQMWLETKKYKTKELRYAEKIKPNGKQIEIIWESNKSEGNYFKFKQKTSIFLIGVSDAEIERDGKKLKLNKIEARISISSEFTKDAADAYKDRPYMKKIYETYIYKHKIEEAKIECYKDTSDYIEEIKNYFDMYKYK